MKNSQNDLKISVIIPMAGQGERFKKAGFKNYKPFINIDGITMLDRCTNSFPKNTNIFIITTKKISNDYEHFLKKFRYKIITVQSHKYGPAYSIWLAKDKLPRDNSYFITYCDIQWGWNFDDVKNYLDYEGIIFTHTGFHPHLVKDNFSAFCKPQKDNKNLLIEIREKSSFTHNWMEEQLSIGLFYVKNAENLFNAIDVIISNRYRVANEYYPSILFNELVKQKLKVYLYDVNSFIHFGIPTQLNDFKRWTKIIKNLNKSNSKKIKDDVNYMLMGGLGTRMKNISKENKALISVFNQPMYKFIKNQFNFENFGIITTLEIFKNLNKPKNKFDIILKKQTDSQLLTLLKALSKFKNHTNIFLSSCDCYGLINWEKIHNLKLKENPDIIIFSFKPSLLVNKLNNQHTHILHRNNRVLDIYIKDKKNKNNLGLAGFYWFKDKSILNIKLQDIIMRNGEKLIDDLIKYKLDNGYKVCHLQLTEYVHIGTPNEFQEFIYWSEKGKNLMKKL